MDYRPSTQIETRDAPTLTQHARALQSQGRWADAIPLYEIARRIGDTSAGLEAALMIGFSRRMLREFDTAESCYRDLLAFAIDCGSVSYQLHAALGLAFLQVLQKEYTAADLTLADIARRARAVGDDAALGKALMARATIAGEQGRSRDLIRYSHEALPYVPDQFTEFGLFLNLATEYRKIGNPLRATQIALYVVQRAPDVRHRVRAMLLILDLAIDERNQVRYHETKCVLDRFEIPPTLDDEAQAVAARGRAVFVDGHALPFVPVPLTAADAIEADQIGEDVDSMVLAALTGRIR